MTSTRPPAVADMFYPGHPDRLRDLVRSLLGAVPSPAGTDASATVNDAPKGLIVPHAGYVYSGPVAASAYACLRPAAGGIARVVLLGPAHRVPLLGLALPVAAAFATPLGTLAVDRAAADLLAELPQVTADDRAHALEHSLEVQLPFLQEVLGSFQLVPLVVGEATPAQVCEVLDAVWGGAETVVVISTDLSHYHDYDTARRRDEATSRAIEALDVDGLRPDDACGYAAVRGMLLAAGRRGLRVRRVDLRNSGDTAGPRDQVVGYGAYVVH